MMFYTRPKKIAYLDWSSMLIYLSTGQLIWYLVGACGWTVVLGYQSKEQEFVKRD